MLHGLLDEVSPVLVEVWAETTKEYGSLLTAARLNGNGAEGHTDPRASGGGSGVLSGVQNMREVRRDKRYGESGCFRVTGSSSGIGRGVALIFAREGARAVVTGRSNKGGEETVDMIKQAGGEATFVQADLLESSQVGELIDRTVSVYGRLDYACNNAGIAGTRVPLIEYPKINGISWSTRT